MSYFKLADSSPYDDTAIKADISALQTGKVDKADGMGLISDSEKQRLSVVTNYDDTSVKAGISALQAEKVDKVDGMSLISDSEKERLSTVTNYELPTATADTLGGIKVGSGLSITNGILSTTASGNLKVDEILPRTEYSTDKTLGAHTVSLSINLFDYFGFFFTGTVNAHYYTAFITPAELASNKGSSAFRSAVICFYLANESISILENAGKLGVPLPKKLKEILI